LIPAGGIIARRALILSAGERCWFDHGRYRVIARARADRAISR
jgi:hypothetical protein